MFVCKRSEPGAAGQCVVVPEPDLRGAQLRASPAAAHHEDQRRAARDRDCPGNTRIRVFIHHHVTVCRSNNSL